jgi:amidase
MSAFPEYHEYDGLGLAKLVRAREITAAELVEEAIHRIETHNPRLNAVVYRLYDEARAAATDLPGGAFRGVPFLLKDFLEGYAGAPTSDGNRLLKELPREHDSESVRRYKATGAIVLGKTNVPEFALEPATESQALGVARNPWDPSRTPGGSSGGSAAAVAARMVPLASGSDGAGSIRMPASCCGLFGLKPSRGRTPLGPDSGEVWRGFAELNVISRSVRDSAAMLDALAGADVGAPYASPPSDGTFLAHANSEPGGLRVACTTRPFLGSTVDEECVRGFEATVRLLEDLGHELHEGAPTLDGEAFRRAYLTVIAAEARADIERAARMAGRKVTFEDFEARTYGMGLIGQARTAADYATAARYLQEEGRRISRFFEEYDLLLTPTLARLPLPVGALQPGPGERWLMALAGRLNASWMLRLPRVARLAEEQLAATFDFMPYTTLFNVTGQPAMSVPLHWSEGGLPIGMHFAGRFGAESTLFSLAGQLERARPWFHRAPSAISEGSAKG